MKRFLLFKGRTYYAQGGMFDYVSSSDEFIELIIEVKTFKDNECDWWHIFDTDLKQVVYGTAKQSNCADNLDFSEFISDQDLEVLIKSEYSKIPCIWCSMPGNYEESGEWPDFLVCLECGKQVVGPSLRDSLLQLYRNKEENSA